MSHHGHEDQMERFYAERDRKRLPDVEQRLSSAVKLIDAISKGLVADTSCQCDTWLENNGYDCETKRRERKAVLAAKLDADIERLRAERAKL